MVYRPEIYKNVLAVIPARYASTRFPGKPLARIQNKPMIQWVWEAASPLFDHLVVATDDTRISNAVKEFGGEVMLTDPNHPSGTDRCLEVLERFEKEQETSPEIVINIQGDEPLITALQFKELMEPFRDPATQIATLARPFFPDEDSSDPGKVKVVHNTSKKALYFSRSAIPFQVKKELEQTPLHHVGLYGFRAEVLKKIARLPVSPLEKSESLEQLRWLENGFVIHIQPTNYHGAGIDRPEDIREAENILKNYS